MGIRASLTMTKFLLLFLAETSDAVLFSSLQNSLIVTASPSPEQVLKAGEDQITVTWSVNQSFPTGSVSNYKTIRLKLCYAPKSQVDHPWRQTEDNLRKDKTCEFLIISKPNSPYNSTNNTYTWTIGRNIPAATYFIRAYAYSSAGDEVAYGQTTDDHKTTNLFCIQAISGRHVALEVCSLCFSAFSILSWFGFLLLEKKKAKAAQGR